MPRTCQSTKPIFPVAGLGTRSLPATKALPKEMLPVVDKPLIQYAVEEAYAAGVREMIFVTGRHKRAIEDHFDTTFELESALEKAEQAGAARRSSAAIKPDDMECVYVRQPQALGLGHAVLCARSLVGDEPFAVLLPDDLMIGTPPVLAQMVEQFDARGALDHRGAGSAGRAHAALRHRRRQGARRPHLVDIERHGREAGARGRAVAPRRRRPLRPDAARLRGDRRPAARRRRRDPAHRRHRRPCSPTRRSTPTATTAGATTAAARRACCRPTSSSAWRTPSWARISAPTCAR